MNIGRLTLSHHATAERLSNQTTVSLIIDVGKAGIDVSCKKKKANSQLAGLICICNGDSRIYLLQYAVNCPLHTEVVV